MLAIIANSGLQHGLEYDWNQEIEIPRRRQLKLNLAMVTSNVGHSLCWPKCKCHIERRYGDMSCGGFVKEASILNVTVLSFMPVIETLHTCMHPSY